MEAVATKAWGGEVDSFDPTETMHILVDKVAQSLVIASMNDDRKVNGILVLRMSTWPWNPRMRFLESIMFYVRPEDRATKTSDGKLLATALLDVAINAADRIGVRLSVPVLWGDKDTRDLRDAFLKRKGLDYAGGTFFYTPDGKGLAEAAE